MSGDRESRASAFAPPPATSGGEPWNQFGNALFVPRGSLVFSANVQLPSLGEYRPSERKDLHEPRAVLIAEIRTASGFYGTVALTHLSPALPDDALKQQENELQLRAVIDVLTGSAIRWPKPYILLEDLNRRHDLPLRSGGGTAIDLLAAAGMASVPSGPTHRRWKDATVDYQLASAADLHDVNDLPSLHRPDRVDLQDGLIGDHKILMAHFAFAPVLPTVATSRSGLCSLA